MTIAILLSLLSNLVVEPENRCSDYVSDDYCYSWTLENELIDFYDGQVYAPYSNLILDSGSETDIEHIVARSEAHDSGLCRESVSTRASFANDLLNLTLSVPRVNRHKKRAKDAGEWLPDNNVCWFASRVIQIKTKYNLSVDSNEMNSLKEVLKNCKDEDLVLEIFKNLPDDKASTSVIIKTYGDLKFQ